MSTDAKRPRHREWPQSEIAALRVYCEAAIEKAGTPETDDTLPLACTLLGALDELDSREFRLMELRSAFLRKAAIVPYGATCSHPRMRCPNGIRGCGEPCGHWWCPDCGMSWDEGAEG